MPRKQRHPVAGANEIQPGERKIVEVDGRSIGIFNVQGDFIAVLNLCPHESAPICAGRLTGTTLTSNPGEFNWGRQGEILVCPWHGWEFDLMTGACLADRRKLHRYQVSVEEGTIYLEIG